MVTDPQIIRALRLLAGGSDGGTEAILLAHGVTISTMIELVVAGYATASTERVRAGARVIGVARLTITDAGRKAIK
jgi:hypothetical protein